MTSARAVIAWMFLDSIMNNVRLLNFLASFQSLLRQLNSLGKICTFFNDYRSQRYLLLIISSVNWYNLFYIIFTQFYSLHVFLFSLISLFELQKFEDCLLVCFEWQHLDFFFWSCNHFFKTIILKFTCSTCIVYAENLFSVLIFSSVFKTGIFPNILRMFFRSQFENVTICMPSPSDIFLVNWQK